MGLRGFPPGPKRCGCLKCLARPADGPRGCCWHCYARLHYEVRTGRLTWEEVARRGWLLPPAPPGSSADTTVHQVAQQ